MKKNTLLLLLAVAAASSVYSAAKPFPGYYIEPDGDSVRCNIRYNDWNVTPKAVTVVVGGQTKVLTPKDISGFGISGYGDYVSAEVQYHAGRIAGMNRPTEYAEALETNRCFLKILVSGYYSLYQLVLPERPYYFISEDKKDIQELVYRVREKDMKVEEDRRYRKVFFDLFEKEGILDKYQKLAQSDVYGGPDLSAMTKKLNEKHSGIQYHANKKFAIQIDIFGGAMTNRLTSTFNGLYTSANKLGSSTSPYMGVNFVYVIPSHFKSFSIGVALGYNGYKSALTKTGTIGDYSSFAFYDTTQYKEELSISNSLLMADFYAMYIVNPLDKVGVYLKAGFNANISLRSESQVYSEYSGTTIGKRNGIPWSGSFAGKQPIHPVRRMFYNVNAAIGAKFGRHKIELDYFTPVNLTTEISFKLTMMGACYYYTIFQ